MKNLLLNELNRMKYLTNHERGVVISEQKRILKENDEWCEPDFELLVRELKNGWHGDKYRWLPEESYNFREKQNDDSYVVLVPKMKTLLPKINFERNKIYLQGDGKIFRVFKGKRHPFGNWCYKPSPKGNDEMELFVNTTRNPDKKTADATTATNTTTDATTATNTTATNTTATNITATNTTQKEKLRVPVDKERLVNPTLVKDEDGHIQFRLKDPDLETNIYAPMSGTVYLMRDGWVRLNTNDKSITIFYPSDTNVKVKEKDLVNKGQIIATLPKKDGRSVYDYIWTSRVSPEEFE